MTRRRRWTLRILFGFLGLIVLAVVSALVLAAHLEFGPVKHIIQAQAHRRGIDVDFDKAGATLGGVHMKNVRVRSAPPDRTLAPDLVSIASIDGDWSPFHKRVDKLIVSGVVLTVVMNDDGTTSLDHWLAGMPASTEPPPPAKPLSAMIESILPAGVEADHVRVDGISVRLIPSGKAKSVTLDGLVITADLANGTLHAALEPAELHITVGDRQATVKLAAGIDLAGNDVKATLDLALVSQDFSPTLPPITKIADLSLLVTFVPVEHRTRIQVDTLTLLDGKASFSMTADLYDGDGKIRPVIHDMACTVDGPGIAREIPADLGLGPIVLEGEPFRCSAKELELAPALKGDLGVTGKIARLSWRDIDVRGVGLDASIHPEKGAMSVGVKAQVQSAKLAGLDARDAAVDVTATIAQGIWPVTARGHVAAGAVAMPGRDVRGLKGDVDLTARSPNSLAGKATFDVDEVAMTGLDVRAAHVDAELDVVKLAKVPLESTGTVKLGGKVGALSAAGKGARGVTFASTVNLAGKSPARATFLLDAADVKTGVPDVAGGALHLEVDAPKIAIDAAAPAQSRFDAHVKGSLGANSIAGTVAGSGVPLDVSWDVVAAVDRAGPARGVKLASKGRYGGQIEHDTTIDVGRVALSAMSVRSAHVHVASKGSLRRQDATVSATLDGLNLQGKDLGSPKVDVTAVVDLDKPHADVHLRAQSPQADIHLVADIDAAKVIHYEIDGKFGAPGPLVAYLPAGPDWSRMTVDVKGQGTVAGIVRSVPNGVPVLVADPIASGRGKANLALDVRGVHYRGAAETASDLETITVRADAELGETRKASVDVDAPEIGATASGVKVDVKKLALHFDTTVDKHGVGTTSLSLRAASLDQTAVALVPVRDLDLEVKLIGDPSTSMTMIATLKNPGSGTSLDLSGQLDRRVAGADAIPDRNSFTLQGQLDQSLDKLTGDPGQIKATGSVSIPFRIESGDLTMFRASAQVRLAKVSVDLPAHKLHVGGVDGDIPILEEIVRTPAGIHPVGRGERGIYPQLRFGDQQPFLGNANYLSINELKVGPGNIGPIAGNIRIDHDVIALDQLEASAHGGKVTGQFLLEIDGLDTTVSFRGKVTGLRPESGKDDVLDANAALTLTPYRLGLEGRIELVRIGKSHLLDLLDLYDPYHADVTANHVRLGLKLGYPKQVRLGFLHGFASMAIELGGLAGVVSISEITGVPIGPALASFLAPVLETK